MLSVILSSILALLVYFFLIKPNKYWADKGVPYIKPIPFFGNLLPYIIHNRSLTDLITDFYNVFPSKRYLGMYKFRTPTLLVRDIELIKQITIKEFDTFSDHRAFSAKGTDPVADKNVYSLTSENGWHEMKATLSPAFTNTKMRMMFDLIDQCAEQFTKYLEEQNGLVNLEINEAFSRYSCDIFGTTAFGITSDSLTNKDNQFYLMGKELTTYGTIDCLKYFGYAISPVLTKLLKIKVFKERPINFFKNLVKRNLQIREEQNIVRHDMIHLLMEARRSQLIPNLHSNTVDPECAALEEAELGITQNKQTMEITEEDITAQAIIFFFGAFDTVAILMCYICYELAKNPHIQKKLYQEIKETINEQMVTYEVIVGMTYLDCVVSETLRKWPNMTILDRVSIKPFTIQPEQQGEKPLHLETGCNIWIPVWGIHRDPKHYPNPEKFDPERFNYQNRKHIRPGTYLPFGYGPRSCIGSRFALLEVKSLTVRILQKFVIVPTTKTPDKIVLSKSNHNPIPDDGVWLGFRPRAKL